MFKNTINSITNAISERFLHLRCKYIILFFISKIFQQIISFIIKKVFQNTQLNILFYDTYKFYLFEKFSKLKTLYFKTTFFLSNTRHQKNTIRNIFGMAKLFWGQNGDKMGTKLFTFIYLSNCNFYTYKHKHNKRVIFGGLHCYNPCYWIPHSCGMTSERSAGGRLHFCGRTMETLH